MSLEFEIWPSDAVQRYVALARTAARGRTTLETATFRGLEAGARAEFAAWDRADVAGFLYYVLRTAGLGVAAQPSPVPRPRAHRSTTNTRRPAKRPPDPFARMRPQDEHVDWSHSLGHLL